MSSNLSESSDKKYEDDDRTGAKDNNCDNDGAGAGARIVNCGGDRNTGAGGGSAKLIGFLSPSTRKEALGAMAKAKASSSTASRKKTEAGKK